MTKGCRHHRGRLAFHAGLAAENRIAQDYERRGFTVARRRWRGKGGEIDLIVRDGNALIFVEVKQSRDFNRAAESLSIRQKRRIYASAEEYLASEPAGSLTDVRFDVALVDGRGDTRIIENAFGHG
ncbi:YraN family protein [Sulfitobacter mediterraneus]|uniref:YraN family protein n=1 Tax=Sulfitobacter mediterraneus TaxID=83219 RepID=UPI001933EA89|nr:YraN family protein [Sulfitobacter mediterraneus]MBM1634225.1 YraN family protein [Sulfitobacter mediterraneus]MBM1642042.1 YraN family protein [Sulfitobacter mediterraneus]MBM1646091.1 YraN family protein [Sulfitobacter mediterraneus]MBM1650137.1 YraN family protein [Sulfitobacter mediterraneus]MBM1654159.1 YraN family protein [Sulfitobacter mediterraneus]